MRVLNLKNFGIKIFSILAVIVLAGTVGICTGCGNLNQNQNNGQSAQNGTLPYTSKEEALKALDKIQIAEPDNTRGMDRKKDFGDWHYDKKAKHNTRFEVLQNQGQNVKVENNKIVSGTWYIKYSGETITCNAKEEISKAFDIDHCVPVSYAWKHGAANWSQDKREEFANDTGVPSGCTVGANDTNDYEKHGNLIVATAHDNRAKSDSGIADWVPSNKDYLVEYAEKWIDICSYYEISITKADYNAIKNILK